MEQTNFYKGIDHVTIHAVEHDIVLTQDIIFDYIMTGKKSPVLNLHIWIIEQALMGNYTGQYNNLLSLLIRGNYA